jgi:DNA-binding CsgD family transcriptional regulator
MRRPDSSPVRPPDIVMGETNASTGHDRRRFTLERLLAIDAIDLDGALQQAAQIVAEALSADKVDAFVYEARTDTLVARGTSDTPMGRRQIALGLHRLPLAHGGRVATAFRTGDCHVDGHVDRDSVELDGVKHALGVRSAILCPLNVNGERRGVVSAVSAVPERFSEDDVSFVHAVARWLALLMHRAELVQELMGYAELRGRRKVLEELMSRLTPRQREVAVLIGGGFTNEQIAQRLVLTPGTVANHVEAILRPLDVDSRTKIAALVAELGLHRQIA